jgi:glycosyltransferase involved in cell wall biosynthesis
MIQPDLFWEPNILIPKKMTGYRGKTMITIHDLFPVTLVQYFGWKYSLYFRVMLKKTIRTTDLILYDSLETQEDAERYFPELKGKKSFIQYVIVPRVQHMENHKTIELPQSVLDKGYFLYVGNMEKRKGVDLLLDSYAEYRKKGGQKALILAGKSRERDVDEKIAAVTDAYEDALYYGYVSDADKQYLYRNCDCFLFPSKAEGFGICVLEAMNYYKPILASDLSIFREIVGDRISYFPLAGDKEAQMDSLSEGMLHYSEKIDCQGYEQAMDQYMPEPLGKRLLELLQSAGIEENITVEE